MLGSERRRTAVEFGSVAMKRSTFTTRPVSLGAIYAEALSSPREGGVWERNELLAPRSLSRSLWGNCAVTGPQGVHSPCAVPTATWMSSSRPSQKGTPCSSRTLARPWTQFWTLCWAGTQSKRESEWQRPPPRVHPRDRPQW